MFANSEIIYLHVIPHLFHVRAFPMQHRSLFVVQKPVYESFLNCRHMRGSVECFLFFRLRVNSLIFRLI